MATKFVTIENAGTEKPIADWGVDKITASFANQTEEVCELSCQGRRYDASFLFAYKSSVIIRYDRERDLGGEWSGGTIFFQGLVVAPHASASGRAEYQGCQLIGPGWFLEELGFEQEYRKLASLVDGVPTYVSPNPTKSRILLNQALGDYGVPTFEKLTTGEQLVEVLNWVLKPFVDADEEPPFQFDAGAVAAALPVDPPVDEVVNITCREAERKMLRWSPGAVSWFDHSTLPPTYRVARPADLQAMDLNVSTKPPTNIELTPRTDLLRPYVRIQYEIAGEVDGEPTLTVIERTYPDPLPTGVMNKFGGVPFVINLRGPTVKSQRARIKTRPIEINNLEWWLLHQPAYKQAMDKGRVTAIHIVTDDPDADNNPLIKTEDGETNLNLPNEFIGTPVDWLLVDDAPVQYQRLQATCKARITYSNGAVKSDKTFSFQFTATNASTGLYQQDNGSTPADPVPVNLERDFFNDINTLGWEGSLSFTEASFAGLPALGQKLNLTGNDNAAHAAMNVPIQRVSDTLLTNGIKRSVEFGPPPHLSLGDLVSLFRVSRNIDVRTPYSDRSTGRASASRYGFDSNASRENSANDKGTDEIVVSSGSATPATESDPAKKGVIKHDGAQKASRWTGGPLDGEVNIKLGQSGTPYTTQSKQIQFYEIETCESVNGVRGLYTRIFLCSEPFKKPGQ